MYSLASHSSFDPRDDIREQIGTERYDTEKDETIYTIDITDQDLENIYVPMYDREEIKSRVQPTLPFISMALVTVINEPHNIAASVRKFIAYVDLDVAYAATSNINIKDFGKKIKDELHSQIRTYQATTNDVFFMNIENEHYIDEDDPRQVIFHYILTIKAENHDAC